MFMILGLVHLDAIVSCDADLPVVPAKQQRKPLKVVTELLQCRCGFTKGTIINRANEGRHKKKPLNFTVRVRIYKRHHY